MLRLHFYFISLIGNLTEGSGSNGSMMGKSEETKLVTINRQNLIDGIFIDFFFFLILSKSTFFINIFFKMNRYCK